MICLPLDEMNDATNIAKVAALRANNVPPALLFEMVRSFVTLASTLNLSHAVSDLASTRQTVRRHITLLEETMDMSLFIVEDRRYRLSPMGEQVLPSAKDLLARATLWANGQVLDQGYLQHLHAEVEDWVLYQQQQPLGLIWDDPFVLPRETFRAWTMSGGEIESPSFAHVRPYLIIYRQSDVGWICVEFGQKSVYVNWFGQDYARSSIGRTIAQMPAGEEFSNLVYEAFEEVQAGQTVRLDHVYTRMPRGAAQKLAPVAYQRLMLSGFFPDKSPAVMSLVMPVGELKISGLDPQEISGMDALDAVDIPLSEAHFERLHRSP